MNKDQMKRDARRSNAERRLGYAAEFVWSFEQAKDITERYLS